MTNTSNPAMNPAPVIVDEGVAQSVNAELNVVLTKLSEASPSLYTLVDAAILASSNLMKELNAAAASGALASITYSATGSNMSYVSDQKTIVISQGFIDNNINSEPAQALDSTVFVLGHEAYHALDRGAVMAFASATSSSLKTAISSGQEVTDLIANYVQGRIVDETSGYFAGWNALVGTLGAAQPTQAQLAHAAGGTSYSQIVVDTASDGQSVSGNNGVQIDGASGTISNTSTNLQDDSAKVGALTSSRTGLPYAVTQAIDGLNLAFNAAAGNPVMVSLAALGLAGTSNAGDPFAQLAQDGFTAGTSGTHVGAIEDLDSGNPNPGVVASALINYDQTKNQLDILYSMGPGLTEYLDILPLGVANTSSSNGNGGASPAMVLKGIGTAAKSDITDSGGGQILDVANVGGITVGGFTLTGTSAAVAKNGGTLTWTAVDGTQYQFTPGADFSESGIGSLVISGGTLAIDAGESLTIADFNLALAQTEAGFAGIHLDSDGVSLSFGSSEVSSVQQSGVGSSGPDFTSGATQTYSVTIGTPNANPQAVTLTLSGASSSDFSALVGTTVESINGDGTFTVTIPAGETSASFSLINTADVGGNAALQLTATLTDQSDPGAPPVSSNILTQNYVEPTDDPFTQPANSGLYDNGSRTSNNGVTYEYYTGPTVTGGSGPASGDNFISVTGAANDSISGGSGNDTIYADFGQGLADGGTDIIQGNGGRDILWAGNEGDTPATAGPTSVKIYGNQAVSLDTAVHDANTDTATGQLGDLIISEVANATLVGGDGTNYFIDDSNGTIVTGPGNDSIVAGARGFDVNVSNAALGAVGPGDPWSDVQIVAGRNLPVPAGYEGPVDSAGDPPDATNNTIFGGSGSDWILTSNGNNYIQLGSGSSTVYSGMGNNTIIGGGGANFIYAGGGSDYIETGDGNTTAVGRAGNNTIIGGAGSDTLFAGGFGADWATAETGNNYVQAGTGNTQIWGSGGNDTLIGGSGKDTIQAGAGNEYIVGGSGNESINGGSGNDTISVGGDGQDTVYAGTGSTTIYGGDGQDFLHGDSGTTVIYAGDGGTDGAATYAVAGAGNTTIYGGDGVDLLVGGSGNDVIYAGDGGDTVTASTVDVGTGNTTVYGGDGIDVINGGSGSDVLYAGDGGIEGCATAVNAGTGTATLYGGAGVSVLTDSVGGSDQLVGGTGTSDMYGIGNDTFIAGTGEALMSGTGDNTYVLNGDGGYDEIANAGGTETLDFAYDEDPTDDATLSAGILDDGSEVLEISDGSTTVLVDGGLTGANVSIEYGDPQTESLTQMVQAADGAGNALDTVIAGTNGSLTFDTGNGDSLQGSTGQDTLSAWGNSDSLTAGAGGTSIYAEGADSTLVGGSGTDTLAAFGANSLLQGGTGNETFEVNDTTEVVQTNSAAASNTLFTSVSYTLPNYVSAVTLTGNGNITMTGSADSTNFVATGNSGDDEIIAGSGQDTLIAGSGVDTLIGSTGTTTFVVNNVNDVIELPDGGASDTVESSVSFTLNGEGSLQLTGANDAVGADQNGNAVITGNSGDDTLIGGSGRDTLIAGSGQDTLITGTGQNTLVVNNASDTIEVSAGATDDTLSSSVSETLLGGLDTLDLTGYANLVGTGNSDATNLITGNLGNDVLIAGSGSDTLTAGTGRDTLVAGSGTDLLDGRSGHNDTFVLNSGFGTATLLLSSASSTIEFGTGISAADLTVSTVVDSRGNLALQISDGSSVAILDDGTNNGGSNFNLPSENLTFQFADGSQLSIAQLLAATNVVDSTLAGSHGNLILNGDAAANLSGFSSNDTVAGSGADDTIVAGSGAETLYGLGTDDQLSGGLGEDTLYGYGQNDQLSAGAGTTVMYGGNSTIYNLTAGSTAAIYPGSGQGVQTLVLPDGMAASDFTCSEDSTGDLIIQSLSGDTAAVIEGYFSNPTAGLWVLTDSSGGQLLSAWVSSTLSSAGNSGSGQTPYENEIAELRQAYSVEMVSILKAIGENDATILRPDLGRGAQQFTFNGVSVQNVTIAGGDGETLASSESDDFQQHQVLTGYETITITDPVYSVVSHPASTFDVGPTWGFQFSGVPNYQLFPIEDANGNVTGYEVYQPAYSSVEQTGVTTHTETIPVYDSFTSDTLGYTVYNVTMTGSQSSFSWVSGNGPFVGTVATGDGNVNVNLGLGSGYWANEGYLGHPEIDAGQQMPPGAFIQVGNGLSDDIIGTGGVDTIAAGLGFDTIAASYGSTVYVPMEGSSTDLISTINAPFYGNGPFPHSTVVLPTGVTLGDLQFKLFSGVPSSVDTSQYTGAAEMLQVTYGDSTLLLPFDSGAPSWYLTGGNGDETDGINYLQFADGTVLTRSQMIALAGSAVTPDDTYNPIVTQTSDSVAPGTTVAASSLFTATDASGSTIKAYQISNISASGGYFTLNGQTYTDGATFDVAADQLSQLQYVGGDLNSTAAFTVEAFDGLNWGQSQQMTVSVSVPVVSATGPGQTVQATEPDEWVYGSDAGADTLIGGFDGDTLQGGSGDDTFEYSPGGGAETIWVNSDANGNSNNILQFGPGITPASLTLSITADDSLGINTGNPNDTVTLESFFPQYPYSQPTINQFEFLDGTSVNFLQLLSQVQPSYGTVSQGDDTVTYSFNTSGGPLYSLQETDASGQLLYSTTIGSDGNSDTKAYQYNSDGTITISENKTAPDGTDLWDSETTLDTQGRISNEIIYPSDGSTINESYAYNTDGSYQETVVTTPANGASSTTVVYNYDANGNLITGYQASGANQTVTGPTDGPATLTGGYAGDTLVGASGQDTFVYNVGSGAETLSETAPLSSSSADVLEFGTGITASALSGNINPDGSVTLSIGTGGDSITLEGFNPLNPLNSIPIQQFDFANGSDLTFTQLLSQMQSSGTELSVTNTDGTTSLYDFNAAPDALYYDKLNASGQLVQEYILNMDGSTETDSYAYNADGSYADTQVQTTAAGVATTTVTDINAQGNETQSLTSYPDGSTDEVTYDSQGRHATEIQTGASGNTTDSTYTYNSDGSLTLTQVETPAGGGAATTVVYDIDSQGNELSSLQTNPDGSTNYNTWNSQGQPLSEVDTAVDGSSNNSTWAYNADGSYATTEVRTPAGGAPATTEVISYDSSGNELNDNTYTPGTDGSYSDYWTKPDGSSGSYWWNSSTSEYQESWTNSNGTTWTDDYQYASGGSPGGTGVSFTETYSDSAGDQGTRQYDASTGTTSVTWYSSTTGTITGTVTDSGFIGLQNDGELTNTQPDLTFFNPTTSPTFQGFLAGH